MGNGVKFHNGMYMNHGYIEDDFNYFKEILTILIMFFCDSIFLPSIVYCIRDIYCYCSIFFIYIVVYIHTYLL